jgi:hypothetical protein
MSLYLIDNVIDFFATKACMSLSLKSILEQEKANKKKFFQTNI